MSVIETTQSLVRLASVNPSYDRNSPGEEAVTEWLLQWAAQQGLETFTQEVLPGRRNVVIRLPNGAAHPHLLLNGHTDTVAVDGMSVAPFEALLKDGRLWGRGTADMKGPLACMLHALVELKNQPSAWRGTVTLACVVDEEATFAGIRHFLANERNFDFAIVGEPTKAEVIRGCKGCLRFFIRAHGKSAHSSTPHLGSSAISAMAGAILALDRLFETSLASIHHPDLGGSTGSIGTIVGGSGVNIVPEFCEVRVDIRLVPGQDWESTYAEIRQAVSATDAPVRWEFDPQPLVDYPFCLSKDHPFVLEACKGAGREDSQVARFSCDASKIAAANIPCVIFGPGDIAQAHAADESIAIDELEQGVHAYVDIMKTLLPPREKIPS